MLFKAGGTVTSVIASNGYLPFPASVGDALELAYLVDIDQPPVGFYPNVLKQVTLKVGTTTFDGLRPRQFFDRRARALPLGQPRFEYRHDAATYLTSPVPLPAAVWLLGSGLWCVRRFAKRRPEAC